VSSKLVRFDGEFELDLSAYELRRGGQPLRLARIPMELLLLLLEKPGQLVTREQIACRVWGKDVFLDTENGINAVVRRVRQVLEDDPDQPRFIQTVVGRGYRFIAAVQESPQLPENLPSAETPLSVSSRIKVTARSRRGAWFSATTMVLITVAGIAASLIAGKKAGHSRGQIDSIAVLPFVNKTGDPDIEYLTDGITEDIIDGLAQIPQVRVMARSTVFHYKGRGADPQKVGHDLAVGAVLSGTLARHGEELWFQAELVDVSDGFILWGEKYNRKLSDMSAVQRDVVRDISEKLTLRLNEEDRNDLRRRTTDNGEAYDLYLRGRYQWNKFSKESLQKAVGYFQQAIAKDPKFALAYAGLADAYHELSYYLPPRDVMPKARTAANKALELDDSLAEAHAALGWVKWQYDWDWVGAEKEFQRSIELSPNYAIAHGMYALYLDSMLRADEGMAQHNRAHELDPLSLIINTNTGEAFYQTGRYDQAIEQYRKTLEIDPNFALVHDDLARAYERKGQFREAVTEWRRMLLVDGESETADAIGRAYSKSGYKAALQIWLDHLTTLSNREYVSPVLMSTIYARLDQRDRALDWLLKACQDRSSDLVFLKAEPGWNNLRSDPRFDRLEQNIGLPQ
jgi:TolB-like protein/DNA-binding winged helix-turn-helix (wHTH) protein/Tfp pilus assembly protein PilF